MGPPGIEPDSFACEANVMPLDHGPSPQQAL